MWARSKKNKAVEVVSAEASVPQRKVKETHRPSPARHNSYCSSRAHRRSGAQGYNAAQLHACRYLNKSSGVPHMYKDYYKLAFGNDSFIES